LSTPKSFITPAIRNSVLIACASAFAVGCGFQQYIAKPISTEAITAKLQSKSTDTEAFHQYLIQNGYTRAQLPLQQWGVDDLTYCALFFHTSLDVARAQWRSAVSRQSGASEKPIPVANTHFARSNNANEDIRPFALGLSIDISFETANKRDIRIENARHLSEAAKLEVAQRAWELRNQVAQSLHAYQLNQKQIALLSSEQAFRNEIVAIFQKRLDLGAASSVELSNAKLQLQGTTAELNALQQKKLALRTNLASQIGLPLHAVETMQLTPVDELALPHGATESLSDAQKAALLNRLDIRIALERYSAAEAKLKLEIAKQYPDIVISPGYAYEFGDKIWSLGLSGLLTILNKNKIAISEAQQLREVEAAQFEALQNTVISEVNSAYAKVAQAKLTLEEQTKLYAQQKNNTQRITRRLSAGETDRLELAYAKLEEHFAEKNLTNASFELQSALIEFENARQLPINGINNIKPEALAVKEQ